MVEPVYDTVTGCIPSYRTVREGLKSVIYYGISFYFHDIQWNIEVRYVSECDLENARVHTGSLSKWQRSSSKTTF